MKVKLAVSAGLLLLSSGVWAQQCPEGIPSAGNPQCLPPQDERSPYHDSSGYGSEPQGGSRPVWSARWGAIASDGHGTYGIVSDMTTKSTARESALKECKNRGGAMCEVVLAYNNQCAAVGANEKNSFSFSAATQKEAEELAVAKCEKNTGLACRVYYSGCSDAVRLN